MIHLTNNPEEEKKKNDRFLAELGALFGMEHLSTDAVVSECGVTKEIIKRIRSLQEDHTETVNEKRRIQNDLSHLEIRILSISTSFDFSTCSTRNL